MLIAIIAVLAVALAVILYLFLQKNKAVKEIAAEK